MNFIPEEHKTYIPDAAFDIIAGTIRERMSLEERERFDQASGSMAIGLVAQVAAGPFTIMLCRESRRAGRD